MSVNPSSLMGKTYAARLPSTFLSLLHADAPTPPPMAAASTTTVANAKERKNVGLRSPQIVRRSDGDDPVFSTGVLYFPDVLASMPSNLATSGASENLLEDEYVVILSAKYHRWKKERRIQNAQKETPDYRPGACGLIVAEIL